MNFRVVKLGGSLLGFEHVQPALRRWLALQPAATNVLIVGGGESVEAIRSFDRRLHLGEEACHWLCIRAMGVTARLAAALWPEFALATRWDELMQRVSDGRSVIVFDTEDFLRRDEPARPGPALECTWSVTSDSIAARVAVVLRAGELALLKSALPEGSSLSCTEAAESGYVDPFFPRLAGPIPFLRAVNLRTADFAELPLAP
jgi:aspartokinase-like uncharacterized kinase